MEISLLEVLKLIPEGTSAIVIVVAILYSLYTKSKDSSVAQVTAIGKLQTDQLTTLISQNVQLAEELHSVRTELTAAYDIINEMKDKIAELEEMVRKKG